MDRYVCIHGHFYQPPRENPWLEIVEGQPSAYPYHDWNERITAECYAVNANARILDTENRIVSIVNNYASISFNFGPTLLKWLEDNEPEVYRSILAADGESRARFSGHGSAIAQPYNHMILPLAGERGRRTQVTWGIRDFTHRFGRAPEGMWLPETAVDVASLESLAEAGIAFTILAPHQATHVRPIGGTEWTEVSDATLDTTMPYRVALPSGRAIAVFFYDGPISRAVAFERLLTHGDAVAARLTGAFRAETSGPQLVHIATDGETFGHHHRHGDMGLAYALHAISEGGRATLTNYGEFLERFPPVSEARILENTSWSCPHGVERWRSDCGCQTGAHPGWSQAWRAPLREALDFLREAVAPRTEAAAAGLFRDVWAARDDYAGVILDRSGETVRRFLRAQTGRDPEEAQRTKALKLMELQRHAQLMFTSCGWFFDDISGIEARQVLEYAGRVLQLSSQLFGEDLETPFLERLARARSNDPEAGDGRRIYEESVRPAMVSLSRVGAHYAVSSLFAEYEDSARVAAYRVDREEHRVLSAGRARLALGRGRVTSTITGDSEAFSYGVLHLGDHNLSGGARSDPGTEGWKAMAAEAAAPFERADLTETLRQVDRHFGSDVYALNSLFRDERQRVLGVILGSVLAETNSVYRELYEDQAPLMRFLSSRGVAPPRAFRLAAELALSTRLRTELETARPRPDRLRAIVDEARGVGITFEADGLGLFVGQAVVRLAEALRARPRDLKRLERLDGAVDLARLLPFEVDFWKVQNVYYRMLREVLPARRREAVGGFEDAARWVERFVALGEKISVRVPAAPAAAEPSG